MTELPKFVARHGFRHEVIVNKVGKIFLRQSPRPRWGRSHSDEVSRETVLGLEPWDAFKTRTEKKVERGTCQLCGREIGNATGVIAHHGYERPGHGWQTHSCEGARFPSFEVSRDRLGWWIEELGKMLDERRARLPKVEAEDFADPLLVQQSKHGPLVTLTKGTREWDAQRRRVIARLKSDIQHLPEEIERQQGRFNCWKPA